MEDSGNKTKTLTTKKFQYVKKGNKVAETGTIQAVPVIRTKFSERINPNKALTLLNMTNTEIKNLFFDKNDIDKANGENLVWSKYFLSVKSYLKKALKTNGKHIVQTYKFGKLENNGRLYVEGYGIQNIQHKLRNFVCGEYYYDFDIKNAFPSILLHICKKYEIPCTQLNEYVMNRSDILSSNELTKRDILIAIHRDKNKRKRDNDWYNTFIKELEIIKPKIVEIIQKEKISVKTDNEINPKSSLMSKWISHFEADIIQKVIKYFGCHASVPMFDGLMVSKNFSQEVALGYHLENINDLFKEEFGGLITFVNKPTTSDIELDIDMVEAVEDYEQAKPRFEKDHFLTVKPFAYWKRNKQTDGHFTYNQIKESDFKNACEEYKVFDFNAKGQMITTSIFKKWLADTKKRKYECIDFIPYSKENICPDYCYNTFEGYDVNKIKEYEEVDTSNFDELIFNLCNKDKQMTDYLMKYIAHMIQYPNKRTEKIIVLKGWTGTGKDTLFRTLQRIIGTKYIDITEDPESLFGNFNNIMDSKLCLFMNELEGADGIRYQEKLKAVASNIKNKVNGKFEKVVEQNNYCRIFVNSNNDGCVNVQVSDRRYIIIKTGFGLVSNVNEEEQKANNEKFWTKYYNNLDCPNWRKSLYEKLMNIDLTDYNVKKAPVGDEKKIMREKNIAPIYKYMKEIIEQEKYEGFYYKVLKGEKLHFIKWKLFMEYYRAWIDVKGYKSDFKIKDTTIKQKLVNCDNSFVDSKQIIHEVNGEKVKQKFSVFQMDRMKSFLKNFIFTDEQESPQDFGQLQMGENKNEMIMSVDEDEDL